MRKANTDITAIAGGMTSQLQVLDLVANETFKDSELHTRRRENLKSHNLDSDHSRSHFLTSTERPSPPSESLLTKSFPAR
jgi:hypothetical protein